MPLPKGFKKNIKLVKSKEGPERRQELLDNIDNQGTFLPRGVGYEDMDGSFIDFVKDELSVVINGEKVPVIFLTIQRWAEFNETWQHSDEFGDLKLPFITIVRSNRIMPGTNQNSNWNEVGIRKYSYVKVPTLNAGREGVDVYKIPQPTSVDISYDVRFFTNKMRYLNKINKNVQELFQSRQHYVWPNEHPMPLHLQSIADESIIDEFENRRFYVQLFQIDLLGYLLDEDEFEVIPTVDRISINEEFMTASVRPKVTFIDTPNTPQRINYFFYIKPRTNNRFKFAAEFNTTFTELETNNLDSIRFKVNGQIKSIPFFVNAGDIINVRVEKDFYESADFTLRGTI